MSTPSPTTPDPARDLLSDLPRPERREALEELVTREFKSVLLMTDEDELPLDQSYFDLGLTSLSITGLKQRLERLLGVELNATLLFNSPTVKALLAHLTEDLLSDLFQPPAAVAEGPSTASEESYLHAALKNLYRR